jgi:sugar lactone lactonase YvrE
VAPLNLADSVPKPIYAPAQVKTIFSGPPLLRPVAVAHAGTKLYVVDEGIGGVVEIASGQARVITTQLETPTGIAVGKNGQLYVTEAGRNRVVQVSPTGAVTVLAGGSWGGSDGVGPKASFSIPRGLCAGADGTLYVADSYSRAVRRVTLQGAVSTFSGAGDVHFPSTVGCGSDGRVVAVDTEGYSLVQFTSTGASTLLAGGGDRVALDGPADMAMLGGGRGIAVTADRIVFSEGASATVRQLRGGVLTTLAGGVTARVRDGLGGDAGLGLPVGIDRLDDGSFAVADMAHAAIVRLTPMD